MKQSRKKKSKAARKGNAEKAGENEQRALKNLLEAFSSVSLEEAASAYREAGRDGDKAAEILTKRAVLEDQSTASTSSSGNYDVGSSSSSNGSDVFGVSNNVLQDEFKQKNKPKLKKVGDRTSGSTSITSAQPPVSAQVVGNAFVQQYYHILHHCPELVYRFYQDISKLCRAEEDGSMSITTTMKAINEKIVSLNYGDFRAEIKSVNAQESFKGGVLVLVTGYLTGKDDKVSNFAQTFFLAPQDRGYFVLNDMFRYVNNATPNPALVGDVVVPIAAEPVPAPVEENHSEQSTPPTEEAVSGEVGDRTSGSTSISSDSELQDNAWFARKLFGNDSKVSKSSGSHHSTETGNIELELPQKVLESLFNMPTPKGAEKEPNAMNWRNIAKKMVSFGQRSENGDRSLQGQLIHAKGDEYHVLRGASHQHWDSMKSYYHKAVTAFTSGEKEYASYLSGQGRLQNKMAREADEKASSDIFTSRNKSIENMITIDLHGQHIKPAMKLLKLHLLFGAYVRSVRSFRVITGYGSHGVSKSKLKNAVIGLLQKEGIAWSEENRGTLLIKLDGQTDFSFLDSGSDSE